MWIEEKVKLTWLIIKLNLIDQDRKIQTQETKITISWTEQQSNWTTEVGKLLVELMLQNCTSRDFEGPIIPINGRSALKDMQSITCWRCASAYECAKG